MSFNPEIIRLLLYIVGLTEAGVELIKLLMPLEDPKHKQAASIISGIFFAFVLEANLFIMPNNILTVASAILTGLIASRGSNFAHEIIKIVKQVAAIKEGKAEQIELSNEVLNTELEFKR